MGKINKKIYQTLIICKGLLSLFTATICEHKISQFFEYKFCGFFDFTNKGKNISSVYISTKN